MSSWYSQSSHRPIQRNMGITIIGTGHYVPGKPVTNDDLSRVMDTSDEWVRPRTGIAQRHFVGPDETVSDLGAKAAEKAIENAGIKKEDIDFIIMATMTPEFVFPGPGGLVGSKIGIPRVPALDIRQQCAGMPYGMQIANGLVETGAASTVLLVGADAHAGFMPWEDWEVLRGETDRKVSEREYERATKHRGVSVLFGDGGAAMVLQKSPDAGFIGAELHTDGRQYDAIYIPGGMYSKRPVITTDDYENQTYVPVMQGRDLFKTAVQELSKVVRSLCEKHKITIEEIDWFVAHQANDRINKAVGKALSLPPEKVPSNIARFGNTSAGTIGILTDEMRRDGRLKKGDLACFFGLGSGLNWGAVLMRL